MIVRIFNAGISNGESPVDYLLSERDHAGEQRAVMPFVLSGNPDTTIAVINSIQRKHKYVSGAIAFRDSERPTREQLHQVIRTFKETFCPGLSGDQFNSLFVLHEDKGNTEVHFVVPMIEFASGRGKRMNIHPPGGQNVRLYEAFTQVMNHRLGYAQVIADPLKLAMNGFEWRTKVGQRDRDNKLFLHKRLTRMIRSGEVASRDQLCHVLSEEFGVEITRQGRDYISAKFPGDAKAKRFRGPFYRADADYGRLLQQAQEVKQDRYLSPAEYEQARTTLGALVEVRRQFNVQAYLSPRRLRPASSPPVPRTTYKPITKTQKEISMKPEVAAIKQIVRDAMEAAGLIRAGRPLATIRRSKADVLTSMRSIRERAVYQPDEDRAHTDMDLVHEVEGALGAIQSDINGATSDVNHAKTSGERSRAELRLIRLTAQKRRLQMQLEQARVRQLNNIARNKLLSR
jgi:hypothetical protein